MPSTMINLSPPAPCNPLFNAEQESDIVDHHQSSRQDMEDDEIYEIPQLDPPMQPTNRLGFDTTTLLQTPPSSPLAGTCGDEWTPPLFRGAQILDPPADSMDITTCSSPPFKERDTPPMTPFSPLGPKPQHQRDGKKQVEHGPGDFLSDPSPCEDPDDEPQIAPSATLKVRTVAKTPVSRLSFPFKSTPARRRPPPPPPPPVRRSYSSLPSPLSPAPARPFSKFHQPIRHKYRQHGHSNHRLQYLKWFWSMREHVPDALLTQAADDNAHGDPPTISNGFCLPSYAPHQSSAQLKPQQCVLPPITIHPRRGDISALRDPYCVDIDRCFVALPTWTIGKTLWMFDVHMLGAGPTDDVAVEPDEDEFDETASEISIDTTGSIVSGDDSDATLVESGSEGDLVEYHERYITGLDAEAEPAYEKDHHCLDFTLANKMCFSSGPGFSPDHALLRRPDLKPTRLDARPSWAKNWYSRWEVLIELSGGGRDRQQTPFGFSDMPVGITSRVEATSKQPTKFFLTEDDTQDDDAWNCVVDVEEAPTHPCS